MRATCCVNSLHLLTARATDIKPENVLVAIDDVEAVIEAESAPADDHGYRALHEKTHACTGFDTHRT